MKRVKPVEGGIYHIFNRGVDKRRVFMEEKDYFRFIHDLWEFNDWAPAPSSFFHKKSFTTSEVKPPNDFTDGSRGEKGSLVEILAYCLMPNHYHLMLRQKVENGISDFMRKVGTGYTVFFNQKHKRTGTLLDGTYKIAEIEEQKHFIYLPYYIHLNPLDLKFPEWREGKIKNSKEAIKFLEEYRWSSHLDYLGKENFPSVIKKNFLQKIFGGETKYKKSFEKWLEDLGPAKFQGLDFE
jgi:putative transposase